ncbi:hypothetical protein JOB18_033367 [Solea senegalensis]|uniref:Uncharacterized protein n=1 Tax=Solea senegalensis TaxID=28829 RepID=A0AAV6QJK3_SOLSE|nr:hypothetical protein JOB18_033367 [Solea senegalensis]
MDGRGGGKLRTPARSQSSSTSESPVPGRRGAGLTAGEGDLQKWSPFLSTEAAPECWKLHEKLHLLLVLRGRPRRFSRGEECAALINQRSYVCIHDLSL